MRPATGTTRPPGRRGFTLVELLAVLFTLAILMALAVGVGQMVTTEAGIYQTRAIQGVLLAAIEAYHEQLGSLPPDKGGQAGSVQAMMEALTGRLVPPNTPVPTGIRATEEQLRHLPAESRARGRAGVQDAFGTPMRYDRDGGIGGRYVIVSAGEDGDFGDADPSCRKDNIRSDKN